MSDVTVILSAIEQGDTAATERLLPVVYDELRRLARQQMARERGGHTLQPTALVHEAYLRLIGSAALQWESRGRFFAAAAEAMRRILIEHARSRNALRNGGGRAHAPLECDAIAKATGAISVEELIDLNDALDRLASEDPPKAELVKLVCFGGLSLEEAAEAIGFSRATAYRHWTFARAWLKDAIGGAGAQAKGGPLSSTINSPISK